MSLSEGFELHHPRATNNANYSLPAVNQFSFYIISICDYFFRNTRLELLWNCLLYFICIILCLPFKYINKYKLGNVLGKISESQ